MIVERKTLFVVALVGLLFTMSRSGVYAQGMVVDPEKGGEVVLTNPSSSSHTFYFRVFPLFQLLDGRVTKAEESPLPLLMAEPEALLVTLGPKESRKIPVKFLPSAPGPTGAMLVFESIDGMEVRFPVLGLSKSERRPAASVIRSNISQDVPGGPVTVRAWVKNAGDIPLFLRLEAQGKIGGTAAILPYMTREMTVELPPMKTLPKEIPFNIFGGPGRLEGVAQQAVPYFAGVKGTGLWVEGMTDGIIHYLGKLKGFVIPEGEHEVILKRIPPPWWAEFFGVGHVTHVFSFPTDGDEFYPVSSPLPAYVKEGKVDSREFAVFHESGKRVGKGKIRLKPGRYMLQKEVLGQTFHFPLVVYPAIPVQKVTGAEVLVHAFQDDTWIGKLTNEMPLEGQGYISLNGGPYKKVTFPYVFKEDVLATSPLLFKDGMLIPKEDLYGVRRVFGEDVVPIGFWAKGVPQPYHEGEVITGTTVRGEFTYKGDPEVWNVVRLVKGKLLWGK